MRLLERSNVRKNYRKVAGAVSLAAISSLALAGCTDQQLGAYMPGEVGTSDKGDLIGTFWTNSWVVLMAIGLLVWILIIWASIAYRRRKNETGMPVQMRYHMPVEIMFTILPIVLVAGFFAFTARDEAIAIDVADESERDVHIEVYGKQWAWDFNYLEVDGSEYDGGVYFEGEQAREVRDENGKATGEIEEDKLPVVYVPVGANVTFDLKSRDVAHSFWIPEFHYKLDTIPGKTNTFSITVEREGEYIGKCAELCGEYHSMMLFKVKAVSAQDYKDYIQSLRDAGQTGARGDEYNRNDQNPGTSVPEIKHEQH